MSKGPLETIAELWDEVLEPPRQSTVGGTRSKQSSKPPANLDGLELRAQAHKLANSAGIATFPKALRIRNWDGAWLSKWQALADKFTALARPEQIQGVYIGKCPQCAQDKRWHEGQTVMVCDCGLFGGKQAWIRYMQPEEVPSSMTTVELAAFLSARLNKEVRATAIRNWKSRGHIEAIGKDVQGRPLYKPLDVLTWARAKGEGLRLPID